MKMKIERKKNAHKLFCGTSDSNQNNYTSNNSMLAENHIIMSDLHRTDLAYVVPQVDPGSPRNHFTVFPEVQSQKGHLW